MAGGSWQKEVRDRLRALAPSLFGLAGESSFEVRLGEASMDLQNLLPYAGREVHNPGLPFARLAALEFPDREGLPTGRRRGDVSPRRRNRPVKPRGDPRAQFSPNRN